jgi:probable phosphoglycerate mutase
MASGHHEGLQEIWLLRHAETEWSRTGKHTGRTDVELTEAGRARARELGRHLAGHRFDLVLSSPLTRARETARLAGLGDPALTDDLLEWDYGEYEGLTTMEIRDRRPDWYLWTDGCPGGEMPEQVGARCDRIVEAVLAAGGDACLVAHGHVLRALAARWLEEPVAFGGRLALSTGSICVAGFEREVRVIWRWNETS